MRGAKKNNPHPKKRPRPIILISQNFASVSFCIDLSTRLMRGQGRMRAQKKATIQQICDDENEGRLWGSANDPLLSIFPRDELKQTDLLDKTSEESSVKSLKSTDSLDPDIGGDLSAERKGNKKSGCQLRSSSPSLSSPLLPSRTSRGLTIPKSSLGMTGATSPF